MQKQEKIRLGFIGAGGISRFHMAAAAKLADRVTLQAVCDINETAAEEKAEKYGIRFVYTDYKDLLASPDIDAVIITLPNFLHAKVSVEALEAGKHVLCEKPMVTNTAEAHAVIRARDQSGKQFMVSMNNRFRKAAQWIHHYVQSGKLGEVYYAKTGWIRRRGIPVWGTWFFDKNLSGGGPLIDLGVHMLDLTLWMLGYPRPISVVGKTYAKFGPRHKGAWPGKLFAADAVYTVEDFAAAFIELENEATIVLETSWASHIEQERVYVELLGTEGGVCWNIDLSGDGQEVKLFREENGVPADVLLHFEENDERFDVFKSFITSIENNTPPLCTAEQGLLIGKILESVYQSSEQGKQVFMEW
ncbi:Gfo/Idh/MocA family protein [Saccharococcus caldoxylosilyticus]|uniref:Gfo/Idh/MocA family protein n=1 Tax=Saccharococcus caldoxylosilyticus TaxID=81408 RepID=UPI001FCB1A89|nr:Gfo/Idh/MocA family oxidoreductase [Parageobacillus caldoxylosilyticus]BDG36440.1 oxidoreductase [Parageobacillus caldoxylosilyticus]BDG40227.1 oxidoreductase [Parageobacillus caldoxylosilyticus]